jgi:GNAT superfamily N-acetyltransferase
MAALFSPIDLAPVDWYRDGYRLTTDRTLIDIDAVLAFLVYDSYWARSMTRAKLERALAGSLPMALIAPDGSLAGFARIVTDCAVFAYLRDVFVLPAHRGRGLAAWIATAVRTHPELAEIDTWMLATADAQTVYARAGYRPDPHPERYMRVPREG